MNIDPDSALKGLWRYADKHERLRALSKLDQMVMFSDSDFWDAVWSIWVGHECLYRDLAFIEHLLRSRPSEGSHMGMSEYERTEFGKLPERMVVYRGCGDRNRNGWSWTLNRDIAVRFAQRSCDPDGDRVIEGQVAKKDILAYLLGRNEHEVVVDPLCVADIKEQQIASPSSKRARATSFFQMAQEGMFEDRGTRRMKAELLFGIQSSSAEGIQSVGEFISQSLPFCQALGLEKLDFIERLQELYVVHTRSTGVEPVSTS